MGRSIEVVRSVAPGTRSWLACLLVLAVFLTGCGGGSSSASGGTSAPRPVINSFAAGSPVIVAGAGTSLSWSTSGATSLDIPGVGSFTAAAGSAPVTPSATTTYTLTATNASGSVSASATVTVNPAPPLISSFTASPETLVAGQSATLAWSASEAATLVISPGVGTVAPASGTRVVSPAATTVYTLTATNAAGTVAKTATVNVDYRVELQAGPGGSLSGSANQVVPFGATTAAVTAVPNPGYVFSGWTGTGGFSSTANPLVLTNVSANLAATANFVPQTFTVGFLAGAGGTLTGSPTQIVASGASCTAVTAVPSPGYQFLNWTGPGFPTSTANPLTVANVTSNVTITATFVASNPTVTFTAGTGGTVSGNLSQTVPFAGSCTAVAASPGAGYAFANWTGTGGFTSSANPLLLTNVTTNMTVTANFTPLTVSVTFLAGTGGTLSGSTAQTLPFGGASSAVTASPGAEYVFANWTGTGGFTSSANPLVLSSVTANMTVTANFTSQTFTVNFLAGAGGTLTGTSPQTVPFGGACSAVTANPGAGYVFVNWTGTGGFTSSANPLVLTNVTSNLTITANFAVQTYTVNFIAGPGGSLTGTTSQVVAHGGACTAVSAAPLGGYAFVNWTGSGFPTSAANPLTVANVTANLTITANFLAPAPTVTSFLPVAGGVGSSVVITGTYFLGASGVSFNGTNAPTFAVNSISQITATVPAGATTGTISVTTSGGTGTSAGSFTVNTATLDLQVAAAYITQATQSINPSTGGGTVPLVKDRPGYLRAFVLANQANTATPQVRVRIYDAGGTLVQTYTLASSGASVPQSVNEGVLTSSWNQPIPGSLLQPGYKLLVDVDPANTILESNEGNNTWPASGTAQAMDVRTLQPFHLTFVPVTTSDGTGNVTAGNMTSFTNLAEKLHPIPSLDLALRGSAMNSATRKLMAANENNDWQNVLDDLTALRSTDPGGTGRYYYGVVKTSYNSGIIGRSWIPGPATMATTGYRAAIGWDKLPSGDSAAAHELGHSLGRPHAPGCGVAGPDASWPAASNYAGGLIGVWGLDPAGPTLYSPATHYDHMSYCDPDWISDYGYKKVLANREISPIGMAVPGTGETAGRTHGLLIWGGIEDGTAELYPAFDLPLEPQPPAPGDHLLTGYDALGAKLFEVSFEPVEVADSPRPRWGVNFTLPLPAEDAARIAELRWTKAGELLARQGGAAQALPLRPSHEPMLQVLTESRTRLLWDAAVHPMVLVKDRATGLGIGFGRNGDFSFQADAEELELHFSNGVRSQVTVLRRPRSGD